MTNPLACVDLATAVIARPAPIIFFDTAGILDVLRVAFRHNLQENLIDSTLACTEDSSREPKSLWLVTSDTVIRELQENRPSVEDELQRNVRQLANELSRFVAVAKRIFPGKDIPFSDPVALRLDERMSEILDLLLATLTVFEGTDDCKTKAGHRVIASRAPASQAKQQYKDCTIFEELLELLSAIRKAQCAVPAIFVTPNANDYGPPPKGHPQIEADLTAVDAQYCSNLSWARSLLS